jgi:hypothetical protein
VYQHLRDLVTHPNCKDGWVYHTAQQWKESFGFTRRTLESAVNHLKKLGLVQCEVRSDRQRNVPKTFYRLTTAQERALKAPSIGTECTNALVHSEHLNKTIQQENKIQQENQIQQSSEPTAEEGTMKNKQVASITQIDLSKLTAPKANPKTTADLYRLFSREYAKAFDGAYPEGMTVPVRKHIAAIKGAFGEDTPRFFELVIKNWASASTYVANRTTGLTPVKCPSLGFIRTGTNLMHFQSWWEDLNHPGVAKLQPKAHVVLPESESSESINPDTDVLTLPNSHFW